MTKTDRDQLAEQMKREYGCAECDVSLNFWCDIVDEIIRQMQWARLNGNQVKVSYGNEIQVAWDRQLSFAPPDWKPPPSRV